MGCCGRMRSRLRMRRGFRPGCCRLPRRGLRMSCGWTEATSGCRGRGLASGERCGLVLSTRCRCLREAFGCLSFSSPVISCSSCLLLGGCTDALFSVVRVAAALFAAALFSFVRVAAALVSVPALFSAALLRSFAAALFSVACCSRFILGDRSLVRCSCLLGRYHSLTAKLARLRCCSDCRPSMVLGRQECMVGTCSLHMLGLHRGGQCVMLRVSQFLPLRSGVR